MSLPALIPLLRAVDSPASLARRTIDDVKASQKTPGLSAAVWKNGAIVWSESLGQADLEDAVRVSARTRFRIGSLSKLLTAAAAARLYEQGLLDIDAPVQQYLPTFPEKSGKITARLLLGHLSGLRHYRGNEYLNAKHYTSVADTLKTIEDEPLLQPPGAKYSYSSYGFNLLGAALERAASQEFLPVIQRQVCEPLQLESTTADDNSKIVLGRTRFYSLTNGEIGNSPYTDLSDRWPSGGFLSTAEDLAHFGAAHLGGPFLKPDTRRLMFTSQRAADGKDTDVGFAWRIATIAGRRVYHHGGDSIGGRAFLLLWPDQSIAVAFASNLDRIKFAETEAMALAEAFA